MPVSLPAMPRSTILTWFAGALAVAFMVVGALLVEREFDRSVELREDVDHSYRSRMLLQQVLSLHQDLETGQRGYVITGDPRFLEPYLVATERLTGRERELAETAHPEVRSDLLMLSRLSQEKRLVTDSAIEARRSGRAAEASALIAGGRGKQVMDNIRQVIQRLDQEEKARLDRGIAAADEARRRARLVTVVIQILSGLMLALAALVTFRTMAERRRALAEAEDLSTRFRSILDSAKDGIITVDPSGTIEALNSAAARMFGYRTSELRGRSVADLFVAAPEAGAIPKFLARLRMNTGETGRIDEFVACRKDGSTIPCEVAVSTMELAGGTRFVAIIRDVTERKQVERMKNEFVSTVSHELRTPLTSIAGSLGLIAGGAAGALPARAERLVHIALTNSQRLVRLINDILDIEKIESGNMPFEITEVPLQAFLEQAVAANQAFADTHNVAIEIGAVPGDAIVKADQDRLMQVLTNLLSNAVKFSPEGERVTVSVQPKNDRWRVSVADQGGGIPEAFRPRIFAKFAQADSSDTRAKGGTGLGLSIVREIMARLGGAVSFETEEGRGTVFHVDIPAARQKVAVGETGDGLPRILHVDDDEDVLRVVASAFEGRARVDTATDLAAARARIAAARYDLLLLDVGLADGSGLDLLENGDTPALIFTAQELDAGTRARADGVLVKSRANLDELVAAADRVLNGKKSQA